MSMADPVSAHFVRELHRALVHLYDASELRLSPLVDAFGLRERPDPLSYLRRLLRDGIEGLRPPSDAPAQSNDWRLYNTLLHRFVEQCDQDEVANDLALSVRQVRRLEALALRTLAASLVARHSPRLAMVDDAAARPVAAEPQPPATVAPEGREPATAEHEIDWLRQTLSVEPADPSGLLRAVVETARPLARSADVATTLDVPPGLPPLLAGVGTVRQALLSIVTAAIQSAPGGAVAIEATAGRDGVHVVVRVAGAGLAVSSLSPGLQESVEVARQLIGLSGGCLETSTVSGGTVALTLPAVRRPRVLVVDDNSDTLQLIQRYLAGSQYEFVGEPDPGRVLAAADEVGADLILLDVMLPRTDGWEVLSRLREHPRTRGRPVIICTILPQEELSLILGAAAFLRKPFTRATLLAAVDRQLARPATGSG